MSDALARKPVEVNTLAKPVPDSLLAARTAIQVRPELQALFKQAKAEEWSADRLADALFVNLPEYLISTDDLWDTCLYLADEFAQFGSNVLIVSRETGQAIWTISEDDIYVPEPVARETGVVTKESLPRLRPDLEGMIVQWEFHKERDQQVLKKLSKRVNQSQFLVQEGDNRLLRATRTGRKKIVEMIRADLPDLLSSAAGNSKEFLDLFLLCQPSEVPDGYEKCEDPGLAHAKTLTNIADLLTSNLRHDPYTVIKRQITTQWVRSVAKHFADITLASDIVEASVFDTLPPAFWLANPDVVTVFLEQQNRKKILPLDTEKCILLHSWLAPVACLCVEPESYGCQSREFLDRWEIAAVFKYTLYLKKGAFTVYDFKDVPVSGLSVEVVS